MDRNDQQAIEGLFTKLASVEQQAGPRDAESERFIKDRIKEQPGAPYFMAQTIVVQEQALAAAQKRIEQLERQGSSSQFDGGGAEREAGGMLSNMFGNSSAPQRGSVPAAGRPSPWGGSSSQQAQGMAQQSGGGGGFLAGAAQTAMGVAGGMFLGNALMGMFGGNEAKAEEPAAEVAEPTEAPADEGMDFGFDDTEF